MKISLFLLASLIATTFAQSRINPDGCGKRPQVENTVTGGNIAAKGAHPWQVSMRYGTTATKNHRCGGSIINNRWILTAAHCVVGTTYLNPANWLLDIGINNRPLTGEVNPGEIRNAVVDKIIMHPAYSSATYKNDIALVRLASTLDLTSNNHIKAVCLKTTSDSIVGEMSYASGWGTLSSGGASLPNALYEVALLLSTDADCRSIYANSYDQITMICAGEKGDGKDTCQGDSGGPLVYKDGDKWNLVGITSWGYGCGDIGVYARVSNYISWITANLEANP